MYPFGYSWVYHAWDVKHFSLSLGYIMLQCTSSLL